MTQIPTTTPKAGAVADVAAIAKPHFTFQHDAFRPDLMTLGSPFDDRYRKFHYDLCQGINMTRVSIALGQMVEAGVMDKRVAELLHLQAASLLAMMTTENNRSFAVRQHLEQGATADE